MLALGCGDGTTLGRLDVSYGLGVYLDGFNKELGNQQFPNCYYIQGDIEDPVLLDSLVEKGPFDVILLEDTLGYLEDIEEFLKQIKPLCAQNTRIISVYYGYLWEPLLTLAEILTVRKPSLDATWLRMADVENFMTLSGFETVKKEWRLLSPFTLFGIGRLINRYVATLPVIRKFCLRHFLVARMVPDQQTTSQTVSVVIPCRNEKGNIEPAVSRLPQLGSHLEIIFVEGHSSDGTWKEIERVKNIFPDHDIKALQQPGVGKGDAVRAGFELATSDILMILDCDLTVPPEDLPKFYDVIASGRGEYVNGSRLIYAMEGQSMRFLNYLANHCFAFIFTYLLNQRLTDTLCGTKALSRKDYIRIAKNRDYFGDFDPFGDFDLIFGGSKLNLKFVEVPVRYARRRYGETQISRFRHGVLLLKMVVFAYRKLKAI